MDARYVATEKAILDGMIQLMKEKPLYMVSIKELTKVAGVNEATFYRHYKDIDDWKRKYEANFEHYVLEPISKEDIYNWEICYRKILNQIASKGVEAQMLVSENFKSFAFSNIMAKLYEMLQVSPAKNKDGHTVVMHKWDTGFFSAGISMVLVLWCRGGYKESVDELIDYIGMNYERLYIR